MPESKTPAEEMLAVIDEAYHELRCQCFHQCRWVTDRSVPIAPFSGAGSFRRSHLPKDGDRPKTHVHACGYESTGKKLGVALGKFSIANVDVLAPAGDKTL